MKSEMKPAVALPLIIAAILACSVTRGATSQLRLAVSATYDCRDVPVHTTIELPEQFSRVPVGHIGVLLKEQASGMSVPGQIISGESGEPQLWWILPQTKANGKSIWTVTLTNKPGEQKEIFCWSDNPGVYLDLLFDGRKVTRYMYAYDDSTPQRIIETYKPFHHIFDAAGENLLTNGNDPNALYPHHRGLFIGWSKIEFAGKEYDFWGMAGGSQVHQKFIQKTTGPVLARSESLIHWNGNDGKTVLSEQRQITVFRQSEPTVTLLEFRSKLKAVNGDVVLIANKRPQDIHKAPEHGGVQYRAHNDIAKASKRSGDYVAGIGEDIKATYLFHKDGIDPGKDKNLPWVAMSYGLNNRRYSIQHIDHPNNPRPTIYSAHRAYGRFGAYFTKKIKFGETLTLRYYIWVVESDMPQRQKLADKYQALIRAPIVEILPYE